MGASRAGRRARQFDVEGAYLKRKFEDGEVVYARPPPNFPDGTRYRIYDERGVPLVWRLKVPLGWGGRCGAHLEPHRG